MSAASLQSPDDPEATFRHKQGQDCRDYVCNLAETCHPANPVQLITKTQVAPNVPDIGRIAAAVTEAGADAITATNTMPGMIVDYGRRGLCDTGGDARFGLPMTVMEDGRWKGEKR